MSLEEIKQRISQLSSDELDELRQYIDMLQSNQVVLDPLPDPVWQEIESRERAYADGKITVREALEEIMELRKSLAS